MYERRVPPGGGLVIGIILGLMLWGALAVTAFAQEGTRLIYIDSSVVVTPFSPPPLYREIWARVTQCAGLVADPGAKFSQIKWFLRTPVIDTAGDTLIGQWIPPDSIFITTGMPGVVWPDTTWIIAHEMLHHRIGVYNDPTTPHPWMPFAFPCKLMPFQQSWAGIMAGRGR